MKNTLTAFFICLCALLPLNMSGVATADAMPGTGPEKNFIYYVDISGSMILGYPDEKKGPSKISVAVELLHAINNEMPDIEANVGVYTFGPHYEYRPVIPFDREALTEAFNQIPTKFQFGARPSIMGRGLQNLDTTVAALPGTVTFIVIADGESNLGPPPADVIKDMYAKYADRICFHFISFAKKPAEKAFIKNLADMNNCSVSIEAVDLLDESVRADFIEKVGLGVKP